MLLDQLKSQEGLTHQEKLVAEYNLEHLNEMDGYSATDLAKASFVSKATVVRLAQKLGCTGYQELKVKLVVESHQKQRFEAVLTDDPITADSRFQDLVEVLPGLYDKAVTNTNLTLTKTIVNRIANYLHQADEIELYGQGVTYHLAQTVAFKFQTLGRQVQVFESLNNYYLSSRKIAKRVAFFISFTGNNPAIIQMAQYVKNNTDTYVVGIAGPHQEELREHCHEIVEIHNRDSLSSLDVVSSFVSCTYIFDLFFSLLLTKQYHHQLEATLKLAQNGEN